MPDNCLSATINHFLSTCFIGPLEVFPEHGECQFSLVKWGPADPNPRVVVAECLAMSARPAAGLDEHAIRDFYTHSSQPKIQQDVKSVGTILAPGGGQQPKERSPLHCLHFDGKGWSRRWGSQLRQRRVAGKSRWGKAQEVQDLRDLGLMHHRELVVGHLRD